MFGKARICILTAAALASASLSCGSDPHQVGMPSTQSSAPATGSTKTATTQTGAATTATHNPSTGVPTGPGPQDTFPEGTTKPGPMEGGPAKRCGELPFDQAWFRARIARMSGAADAVVEGKTLRITERFTPEGRRISRAWIKQQYEALGYQVEEDPFTEGVSLVVTKPGNNPSYYVISSHYDTVPGSPGADDDATGVITSLAIAAALAPCQLEYSVRFIAFDQEERKMTGAYHYARTEANAHRAEQILGDIQVEMTGYDADGDGAFNIVHCDKPMNMPLVKVIEDTVKEQNLALFPVGGCTTRSDHQAFWSIDRPAIAVSELFFAEVPDRTPCYHQSCDTYDKVNFNYMDKLARVLTHATFKLTGAR